MIKQLLNLQNILSILGIIGAVMLTSKINSCQNAKELHRMDKIVADYEDKRKIDSSLIANQNLQIFDLRQSVDIAKGNEGKLQLIIAERTKTAKVATQAIEHYEVNGLIRYFVEDKRVFKKDCYREVFTKPDNICK